MPGPGDAVYERTAGKFLPGVALCVLYPQPQGLALLACCSLPSWRCRARRLLLRLDSRPLRPRSLYDTRRPPHIEGCLESTGEVSTPSCTRSADRDSPCGLCSFVDALRDATYWRDCDGGFYCANRTRKSAVSHVRASRLKERRRDSTSSDGRLDVQFAFPRLSLFCGREHEVSRARSGCYGGETDRDVATVAAASSSHARRLCASCKHSFPRAAPVQPRTTSNSKSTIRFPSAETPLFSTTGGVHLRARAVSYVRESRGTRSGVSSAVGAVSSKMPQAGRDFVEIQRRRAGAPTRGSCSRDVGRAVGACTRSVGHDLRAGEARLTGRV